MPISISWIPGPTAIFIIFTIFSILIFQYPFHFPSLISGVFQQPQRPWPPMASRHLRSWEAQDPADHGKPGDGGVFGPETTGPGRSTGLWAMAQWPNNGPIGMAPGRRFNIWNGEWCQKCGMHWIRQFWLQFIRTRRFNDLFEELLSKKNMQPLIRLAPWPKPIRQVSHTRSFQQNWTPEIPRFIHHHSYFVPFHSPGDLAVQSEEENESFENELKEFRTAPSLSDCLIRFVQCPLLIWESCS